MQILIRLLYEQSDQGVRCLLTLLNISPQLQETFLAKEFLNLVKYCKRDDSDYDGTIELVQETDGKAIPYLSIFLSLTSI